MCFWICRDRRPHRRQRVCVYSIVNVHVVPRFREFADLVVALSEAGSTLRCSRVSLSFHAGAKVVKIGFESRKGIEYRRQRTHLDCGTVSTVLVWL